MKLVCINCPLGCNLEIDDNLNVSGNNCNRGKEYAVNEMTHPLRSITTTISVKSVLFERLPVISSKPIPKDKMMDVMRYLKDVEVSSPVSIGEVIVENILDTGSDIIASRSIDK